LENPLRVAGRSGVRLMLARAGTSVSIRSAWRGSKSPHPAAPRHLTFGMIPAADRVALRSNRNEGGRPDAHRLRQPRAFLVGCHPLPLWRWPLTWSRRWAAPGGAPAGPS